MQITANCPPPADLAYRTGVRQRLVRYGQIAQEGKRKAEELRARITSLSPKATSVRG
jgi:hypothetical protein